MFDWLFYFAILIGFFPILILKIKKEKNSHETFFIEPFLWLVLVSSFYELIGTDILLINTAIWFRLYLLFEFLTLLFFFYQLLAGKYKLYFLLFSLVYLIVFLFLLFNWNAQESLKTDSYLSVLEIVFVFCSSIIWFKKVFTDLTETSFLKSSNFYFISGLIIYFSGTLFLFLIGDLLLKASNLSFEAYWNLNIVFNIILRLFLIIGVWKVRVK